MTDLDNIHFPSAKWGSLAVLLSLPVVIIFACFGDFGRGLTAGICTAIIIGVVKTYWVLRERAWFWVTIAILAALHVPFVIFFPIPMTRNFTVWELLPVGIIDFGVMSGCIKLVAKAMQGKKILF